MKKIVLLLLLFVSVSAFSAAWYEGPEVEGYERFMSTGDMSGWYTFESNYTYFAVWLDVYPNENGDALFLDHECWDHVHLPDPDNHQCPGDECSYRAVHHTSKSFKGVFAPGTYWFWMDGGDFQIFRKANCPNTPTCDLQVCDLCHQDYCTTHEGQLHGLLCPWCNQDYCGTHDCPEDPDKTPDDCPNGDGCAAGSCGNCGQTWACKVHADTSGHNLTCPDCNAVYCGSHTCPPEDCPDSPDCVLSSCNTCGVSYCKTHADMSDHNKTCPDCQAVYCGSHTCPEKECPNGDDCSPGTCGNCGTHWPCEVHADTSGHNLTCSQCEAVYCGSHTCPPEDCPNGPDCGAGSCGNCGQTWACKVHADTSGHNKTCPDCNAVYCGSHTCPPEDCPNGPDCGAGSCGNCGQTWACKVHADTSGHNKTCPDCKAVYCGSHTCSDPSFERHDCPTETCPKGCTKTHCSWPGCDRCQFHGPICVHKPATQCPNTSECKIKYCKGCGGKLCTGATGHLPSSHDHSTGGGGDDEPEDSPPLEVGEFYIPDLEFIDIIKARIFPTIAHELPTESTIFIWGGLSSSWLPDWANSSITSAVQTVRTFALSDYMNNLAFWVRNLSRLVMSIVFCIAVLKFLNK